MISDETLKEIVGNFQEELAKNGVKDGLIYDADFELPGGDKKTKIDGLVFGIQRFRYALHPHAECKLLDGNLNEVVNIIFTVPEYSAEPIEEYSADEISNNVIFDIEKALPQLLKDVKLGGIKKEVYLGERDRLKRDLEEIEKIISENSLS